MNPQDPYQQQNYDPRTRVANELTVTQPGEIEICTITRHPIGIIAIYAGVGILLAAAAVIAFAVVPTVLGDSGGNGTAAGAIIFLILTIIGVLIALISTRVYWANSWVVTSDSVTQIAQVSLFSRQSSQLALANIEDVTAEQKGILSHIFNYGILRAETAGHRSKFVFSFCPNPNYYAQRILAAREALGSTGHHGSQVQQTAPQAPEYQPPAGPGSQTQPPYEQKPPGQYQPPADLNDHPDVGKDFNSNL